MGIYLLSMAEITMRIMGYRCERCGHSWAPRNKDRAPKVCPNLKCKSPYWNKPRQKPAKNNKQRAGGRHGKEAT